MGIKKLVTITVEAQIEIELPDEFQELSAKDIEGNNACGYDITKSDDLYKYAAELVLNGGQDGTWRELAQTHLQFKEGEIVELVEDLQTRGGFETIFAKGTKGSVVSKERGSDIRIDFNGDARWCPISILKLSTQDPSLISGADALRALADGKEVEANNSDFGYWIDARNLGVKDFFDDVHIFRLKPQTIKVELELPKPFEPKEDCHVYILDDGKTDGYRRYSYEVHGDKGNTFIGIWRTEDEIKQVVEQLRKIRGAS